MPELPEVETIARKLARETQTRAIVAVDVLWERTVDRPNLAAFREALTGATVDSVRRRGKLLLLELDTHQTVLVHLRMSGRFTTRHGKSEERHRHTRLSLEFDDGTCLDFVDQRKFGRFYLVDDPTEMLDPLGPEPLDPAFTAQALHRNLIDRRGEIKRLLLNQHFIAGIGNIYASEALWQAGIHPRRIAGTLSEGEAKRLHYAVVDVLSTAIGNGGTSLEDRQYVYPNGGTGKHQQHLGVYDRAGDACPKCGYVVERIVQGQRSTYLCPICQPIPDNTEEQ